jgi:pyruvate dehydrogenase E1 component
MSTTMAFVRMLTALLRDKKLAKYIVPIVPDESRTFGMEGLFRQLGIYSSQGQLYEPVDSDTFAYYREEKTGQMLQEGICEAGGLSSWIAAGTSYANHGLPMLPFYIFYSMFGFQRVGDLIWAAGDSRTRGFLLGGTSGRTTLSGEGLQHQDGHSHLMAAAVPNCIAYDPTFAYELVTIVQDGMRRMLSEQEDVFYYVTVMNENYAQPAMPEGARDGILRGLYLFKQTEGTGERVQLLGSGTILREAIAAADLLRDDFGIGADVWSATSFTELAREGIATERWNLLHPAEPQRTAWVTQQLANRRGPVVATTDYVRAVAEQIRPYVPGSYRVLGTDGFGRSDLRERLRRHFEVDRGFIAATALKALCDEGRVPPSTVRLALEKYGISVDKPFPAKS